VEVLALTDASGPFFQPRAAAFPAATAADWALADRIDPAAAGADGGWLLDFRCFALRVAGRVLLVDAGIGPAGAPASSWAPAPGRLPDELAAAGIRPADVSTVVLTHLHSDHSGWSVDAAGTPTFPNARHVVQGAETGWLAARRSPLGALVVEPLRRAGLLDEVSGPVDLGGGITAVPTPGHTPGHQSVVVEHAGEQLVITGDVLVHAVQLADPDLAYAHEDDRDTARRTRRAVLARARDRHALLATAHLRQPFVPAAGPG
jgi:glyoxylase-like metal-dependent hydrolase (beta-lactamase superfamily II)